MQVRQFILDAMHTLDGGVTVNTIRWIFALLQKIPKEFLKKSLNAAYLRRADSLIQAWSECTPYEFQRRVRPISKLIKWKTIEGRTFLMYLSTALFHQLLVAGEIEEDEGVENANGESNGLSIFSTWVHLVKSVRLLSGDSILPVPQVNHCSLYIYLSVF